MKEYHSPFEPNCFYHVFNRTNGEDLLFREEENYRFFLRKCDEYLSDYVDIWAYCLIPNHFHLLIKVRNAQRLAKFSKLSKSCNKILSNQFRKLFISYTKSFNKLYNRHGSLFQKQFKHIKVNSRNYLKILIHYIHHNPIHHNYIVKFSDWNYSSYNAILSESSTKVNRKRVIDLFSGKRRFKHFHQELKDYKLIDHLTIN